MKSFIDTRDNTAVVRPVASGHGGRVGVMPPAERAAWDRDGRMRERGVHRSVGAVLRSRSSTACAGM